MTKLRLQYRRIHPRYSPDRDVLSIRHQANNALHLPQRIPYLLRNCPLPPQPLQAEAVAL